MKLTLVSNNRYDVYLQIRVQSVGERPPLNRLLSNETHDAPLIATNRVDLVRKLLRHIAHLGAKIVHGVAQRLHRRRVRIRVHLEYDSVIRRVRVLRPGEQHVRVLV